MFFRLRLITVVMVLLGLITPLATYARSFSDVSSYYKHYDAIDYLSDSGLVGGYADGNFKPDSNINRAEFTKVVISAAFDDDVDTCIADNSQTHWTYMFFPDVPIDKWFAKYVCTAKVNGVVSGYSDGSFKPGNSINFAEGLKIILDAYSTNAGRTRTINSTLLYISDGDWYAPYFSYAYNKNLINRDKFYHPAQYMTRGEMAEIIYRLETIEESGGDEFEEESSVDSDEYTITIPRLNIINLNVSFADPYNSKKALETLKNGLGHYLSPPGDGKKLVIFGHSSGYSWDDSAYKTILRQINKIQTGDEIYINYQEKGYAYQVYKNEILAAKQLNSIMTDYGYEELALYTCWPPDSIKQRYVVYASPL